MTVEPMDLMEAGHCRVRINFEDGDSVERKSVHINYSSGVEQRPRVVMIFAHQKSGAVHFERLLGYPDTDTYEYQVSSKIGTIMDTEDAVEYDDGFETEADVESIEILD